MLLDAAARLSLNLPVSTPIALLESLFNEVPEVINLIGETTGEDGPRL